CSSLRLTPSLLEALSLPRSRQIATGQSADRSAHSKELEAFQESERAARGPRANHNLRPVAAAIDITRAVGSIGLGTCI
ncbi:MAG: hypothetical protein M3R52_04225, partial [Acidobacteriota bacterium]|nr:hypothetical protein [Acidobacteriota bacterium]